MSEPHVLAEVSEGVGTITLNRPAALNALSPEMLTALVEITGRFERDAAVRCVVLRGAGDHFMAGGDVKRFHEALTRDAAAYVASTELRVLTVHQVVAHLRRMPKPVLASVQGAAAGFGLSLVMACDLAIAAEDAVFTVAYRHVGLSGDGGATYFLPRLVGERRALELALLAERFDARRALELGLVNRVVPRPRLAEETARLARQLADGPTVALGITKQLIRGAFDRTWDEHSHREAEGMARAAATEDHREGVQAFVEKRRPVFRGR